MSPAPSAFDGRLHPAAIGIVLVREMRALAFTFIPSVLDLFRGTLTVGSFTFPIAFGAFSLARAVLEFLRFRFRVSPETLVIDSGWMNRSRKIIPLARIQSVDTVRRLTHRLFGVVELRVEVVGGQGRAEGTFPALGEREAERLRRSLSAPGVVEEVGVPEPEPIVRLTPGEIFMAGVTGGRIATLGLIVAGLLQQLSEIVPEDEAGLAELLASGARDLGIPITIAVLGIAIAVVVVSVIVSLIATVLVYWDFTVRRTRDDLVVARGLLEQRRSVIPLRRVQAVRVHENLLRRPFRLAAVTVVVAGYAESGRDAVTSSVVLPIGSRDRAFAIAGSILPAAPSLSAVILEPAPRRAMTRRIVRAGLVVAAVSVTVAVVLGRSAAWGLVAVPIAVPYGIAAWRSLGHAVEGPFALTRRGVLDRVLTVAPVANLQLIRLRATPPQRARRLATILLKVPKGSAGIIDVDRARAEQRFAELRAAMQTT